MTRILPLVLNAPCRNGLNKEQQNTLLGPEWATSAMNTVLTRSGRIGARKGWTSQTSTAITGTPSIEQMFEYITAEGDSVIISAADNKIFRNITDFSEASNDITPTSTPTGNNWQFVNFNNKVIGAQAGHDLIRWTSLDSAFETVPENSGTRPEGYAVLAAFGRLWVVGDDGQTIYYSALLDETRWAEADGGGLIDMSNVWTRGMDSIRALAAFGSNLIVFGENHIVMWSDSLGSALGIDPMQMYVVDTIEGTGAIARDSVAPIGEGDLAFLSRHGVQFLGRVIQSRANPIETITKTVRTYLSGLIQAQREADSSMDRVHAVFHPEESFYLLHLPDVGTTVVVDTRQFIQDGDNLLTARVTEWRLGGNIRSLLSTSNGRLLLGSDGVVGRYQDNSDNGESYQVDIMTGWLDFQDANAYLKILKEISAIVSIGGSSTVSWRWEYDFEGNQLSRIISYEGAAISEYNSAEYDENEYAGGLTVQKRRFPGRGTGQFIRVGMLAPVAGFDITLQQIQLVPKIGRLTV